MCSSVGVEHLTINITYYLCDIIFSYGVKQNYSENDNTGNDSTEPTAASSYYVEFDEEHLLLIKQ